MFPDAFLPINCLKRLDIFNNYKLFNNKFYPYHTRPALSSLSHSLDDLSFGSNVFLAIPWQTLQDRCF
jgi:hypothetical protein